MENFGVSDAHSQLNIAFGDTLILHFDF